MPLGYHIDEWCQVGWVITVAMRHSTAILPVIYVTKDNIKIEFKHSIHCPVALLFPLAMREKLSVRRGCWLHSQNVFKRINYLYFHTSIRRHPIKTGYTNVRCCIWIRFIPTYLFQLSGIYHYKR
jgi:hypothetical protein